MKTKRTHGISEDTASTASNVIYSTFLAIMCSSFYFASPSNGQLFSSPYWQLPHTDQIFVGCVILYMTLNWLSDTVYHANPGTISDYYLISSLVRITLFGFCFYEGFNHGLSKYILFAAAATIEILIEYSAYRTSIRPAIEEAQKIIESEAANETAGKITGVAFSAAKSIVGLMFFIRTALIVGILFFSYSPQSSAQATPDVNPGKVLISCVFVFTLIKGIAWWMIRQQDITSMFKNRECVA
jgi:hypothetical protein